jgi:hypothetical protein
MGAFILTLLALAGFLFVAYVAFWVIIFLLWVVVAILVCFLSLFE